MNWREIMPAIPLARGVPVFALDTVSMTEPRWHHATCLEPFMSIEDEIRSWLVDRLDVDRYDDRVAAVSVVDIRVDLTLPLGFAHALRWRFQQGVIAVRFDWKQLCTQWFRSPALGPVDEHWCNQLAQACADVQS